MSKVDEALAQIAAMEDSTNRAFQLSLNGHRAPVAYDRPPTYEGMIADKDVLVPMRRVSSLLS